MSSSGTQSPPLDDCHPMGACSVKGGNVGGIPDSQQRSQYFDVDLSKEKGQTQAQAKPQAVEPQSTMEDTARVGPGQQIKVDNRQPARDPLPRLK